MAFNGRYMNKMMPCLASACNEHGSAVCGAWSCLFILDVCQLAVRLSDFRALKIPWNNK